MPLNKGYPTKKHHCDTKSEPPYLAFTQELIGSEFKLNSKLIKSELKLN
jgi:hypothetical protein